jgi:hypothetical protein
MPATTGFPFDASGNLLDAAHKENERNEEAETHGRNRKNSGSVQ